MKNSQKKGKEVLKKRLWTKYLTKGEALSLMYYNPNSSLFKSYKNTSYCSEVIQTDKKGNVTSTYCKNRWCRTCNRIKTALLINGYFPEIKKLEDLHFVTLTSPTVLGSELLSRINEYEKAWRLIYKKSKKIQFKRNYKSFIGVRKAECSIRPRDRYHYHYHILLEGKYQAEWLVKEWLERIPGSLSVGQDIRKADENSIKELFKYAIKSEVKGGQKNAVRYDVVFNSLRRKRTYQAFGGIRKIKEDFSDEDLNADIQDERIERVFKWVRKDWFDLITGEALVGLEIPDKVLKLSNYPENIKIFKDIPYASDIRDAPDILIINNKPSLEDLKNKIFIDTSEIFINNQLTLDFN